MPQKRTSRPSAMTSRTLLPCAVGARDLLVVVDEQGEVKFVLPGERPVRVRVLRAYSQYRVTGLREVFVGVPEVACLDRAAGRVVDWVEVDENSLAFQI